LRVRVGSAKHFSLFATTKKVLRRRRRQVGDANDESPEFVDEPFTFKVKEGLVGATVGTVKATDNDVGRNAKIFYSVRVLVPRHSVIRHSA
jgi:hypothetical protein